MGSVTPKWAVVFLIPLGMGCGATEREGEQGPLEQPRVASTRGSAVVLSRDERVAVVTNRSAGVVTVFHLDPQKPLEQLVLSRPGVPTEPWSTEIDRGPGSEPWAAVIGADDDTAYVISRRDQEVFRILELHDNAHLDPGPPVRVGSEPTAIAIAPSGARIFVANWGDGTISVVRTYDFTRQVTLDLNGKLTGTVPLGIIAARQGVAHPRALAITDNGDSHDGDETLYATEFFSQPIEAQEPSDDLQRFDQNRQGIVYPIPLSDEGRIGEPISIAPVLETGFLDSNGSPTACFPNQLYAAAADGGQLFVTSMCASPVGPVGPATNADATPNLSNFKTVFHPVVFVIDTATNQELPEQRLVLTRELERLYADDSAVERRMPLIPNDIAFIHGASEDPRKACVTAMGADAVFCVDYDEQGVVTDIGSKAARFTDLHTDPLAGRLPVGLATSKNSSTQYALVANDNTGVLSVVDVKSNTVSAVARSIAAGSRADETLKTDVNRGRALFATGLNVWSFKGEAWGSCEGCHPDGLSDGVTWFFARGPRRTISTAGTYASDAAAQRRVMLWTANIDEIHDVEVIVRSVTGGVGALLWNYPAPAPTPPSNEFRIVYDGTTPVPAGQKSSSTLLNNLNGSLAQLVKSEFCSATNPATCDSTAIDDWNKIDAFIRSLRAPRAPTELDAGQVSAGQLLFTEGGCAACHAGPGWTLSRVFYTPGAKNNGSLGYSKPALLDPAALGDLRAVTYSVPPDLLALNPPVQSTGGYATLRRWEPGTQTLVDYAYDAATHRNDQINCVLRAVGTFPPQPAVEPWDTKGIAAQGGPSVIEVRSSMKTSDLAVGRTGFNIPSLLGVAAGAPYFHGGNARTLEEVFDDAFHAHHQAVAPGFLPADELNRADKVRALVAYLLSIDDTTETVTVDERFDFCKPSSAIE